MQFIPLHVHSTKGSILDALAQPKQIVQRCADLNYKCCGITDHGSLASSVDFVEECKKKDILPILGLEAYISTGPATDQSKESKNLHQIILAKNLEGWKKLIQLVSRSNDPDVFYYKPRIDFDIMGELCDYNLVTFSGHPGSTLYNIVLYGDEPDSYIYKMLDIFGKDNFFIEIQLIDERPEVKRIMNELRTIAEYHGIKCIATCDAHYATPDSSFKSTEYRVVCIDEHMRTLWSSD